jgi:tetratricopeptide (TPR) repeat protein
MHSRHAAAEPKAAEASKRLAAGDFNAAIALFREASDSDPQDAQIAYRLALALDKAGDTEAERTTLERTLRIDPTLALAQNQLGYVLSRSGDIPDAEEHFHLAVQSAPAYAEAWVNYAAALAMQSHFEDASKALAQALRLEPENAQARGLKKDLAATHPARSGGSRN